MRDIILATMAAAVITMCGVGVWTTVQIERRSKRRDEQLQRHMEDSHQMEIARHRAAMENLKPRRQPWEE